jgi:hypothetical protein
MISLHINFVKANVIKNINKYFFIIDARNSMTTRHLVVYRKHR